jgi:hypothetical protein
MMIGWGVLSLRVISDKGQCVCMDLAYILVLIIIINGNNYDVPGYHYPGRYG